MILRPASTLADTLSITRDVDTGAEYFSSALWLLKYIWRWNKRTDHSESVKMDFASWRDGVIDDLEFAFRDANRIRESDDEIILLTHLVRINKILGALDADIKPWISASSKNFLRITQKIFDDGLEIDEEARPIIEAYIANIRAEVRQIMSWKNPELEDLIERATVYGF